MNVPKSEYISCLRIHGVPLLPPVLTQASRKEMEYYKMLAISTEKRIAALKSATTSNAYCASITCSNTEGESATEQQSDLTPQHDDKSIHIHQLINQIEQTATQKLDDGNFETTNEFERNGCENPETKAEFASMLSDVTIIDDSIANREKSPNPTSNQIKPISEYNISKLHKSEYCFPDICLVGKTTKQGLEIIDVDNVLNNISDNDSVDGIPAIEKITKNADSLGNQQIPKRRLENSKKFTGSLNDISSTHFDSLKLVRQRSYTIEHPSPVLLAHLEVESINSGMDVSSISMSESCTTLPRLEKKRPSWDLEMAKVKWTSMTTDLDKHQYNTKGITDDHRCLKRIDTKKIRNSPKQGQKALSAMKIQQSSRKPICRDLMTSLQNDTSSSNSKTLSRSSTSNSNKIPLRRTVSTQKESFSTQNIIQKEIEKNRSASQSNTTVNSHTIQEIVEKIQTQQDVQMAALLEKQKLEQVNLQNSFEEQKNNLMKQLKQICPNNPSHIRRNKENLDVNKNGESETDKFMARCEEVLNKGRIVLHNVKIAKKGSSETPENINNTAPVNLQTIFSRPEGIDTDSNSSSNVKPNCGNNDIMTDRTNDTLADLNITLSSDPAEDSCRDEMHHKNSISRLPVNQTFIMNDGFGIGKPELKNTFPKSLQPSAKLDSNDDSTTTQLDYIRKPVRKLFQEHPTLQQQAAATRIVAWCKGYLVRRLLRTSRVRATVQTIRDALCCALQLHRDREGIRGADIDLHRRLIQQITAACYSIHDTFVSSSAAERCRLIAHDRRARLSARPPQTQQPTNKRINYNIDKMSQSHLGVFPSQTGWIGAHNSDLMTRSNYGSGETLVFYTKFANDARMDYTGSVIDPTAAGNLSIIDDKHHGSTSRKCIYGREVHSRKPWR